MLLLVFRSKSSTPEFLVHCDEIRNKLEVNTIVFKRSSLSFSIFAGLRKQRDISDQTKLSYIYQ